MKAKILIILRYALKAVKALIYIISGGHICGCQSGNSDSGTGCSQSGNSDSGTGCSQSGNSDSGTGYCQSGNSNSGTGCCQGVNSDSGTGCFQSGESDSEAVSNESDGGVSPEAEKTGTESGEK